MHSVTCAVHGGEVDATDTVELPMGPVCLRCYEWVEDLLNQDEDEENETYVWITEEEDEDDEY